MTLLLSRSDLVQLLKVDEVVAAAEAAFAAYSGGETVTPLRVGVEPPGTDGVLLAMPCAIANPQALGSKVVSVFRGNAAQGLPTVTSVYLLNDYATGAPLAIMDGSYLTALRTAAASAVATRHLARTDARTLGIFGTGVQAHHHVDTIRVVRPIDMILVSGTSGEKSQQFARDVQQRTGVVVRAVEPREAAGADILALGTTSPVPVLDDAWVSDGCHVNAVGAFTPTTRELPGSLVERSRIFVDTRAGAFSEAGDLLLAAAEGSFSLDTVAGEIGEVISGRCVGRSGRDEITVYKSVGAAFLDAATARLAYEQALAHDIGTAFDLQA